MATNRRMKTAPVYDATRRFASDQERRRATRECRMRGRGPPPTVRSPGRLSLERSLEPVEALTNSRSTFLHDVTQPPDCVNQFLFERLVNFAAQSSNVYLDEVSIAVEVHVPDLLGNH